ncbi:YggS family pyridoxal phosphate-dependent enzyme [Planktosalinus lacus]|uniref:Pyridoxal phosphate homeostasis protein n=1 Tax=Planktosalinus lacus TaxID=1526573 RepID=A0A8J2VA95_9FLAO|nr:YggS family pyridoxal phosphate-dependent enzyme [Planktosalinus lacus]GGD91564.1 YggS family pyridoxal phosphate enzyme [Planktosalinus lacus]
MISENLKNITTSLPENVTLVAVSKTKSVEEILEAYNAGHRDFGENKVQEMTGKWEELPKDIIWHMIGHVQRNKVKYMAPFVHLIHGVDSLKLLKEINKQAKKNNRTINCLLQVYIAKENSKFGLDPEELTQLLEADTFKTLENVRIIGLMGMATFTDNKEQINNEFKFLKTLYDQLKNKYGLKELSMGMSSDYTIALQNGSTMVRIGSAIFGERNYN